MPTCCRPASFLLCTSLLRLVAAWTLRVSAANPCALSLLEQLPPLPLKASSASCCCAAIQADTSQDLAYDSELVTVGLSNLLTSVAGVGFSGSYIFSQTLFSLKMSVDTPLMGILLAGG